MDTSNYSTIAQSGKMYPYDCEAVAGAAINFLKSGLRKKYKQDMTEMLIKADNLIQDTRFTWDYCSYELSEQYDSLYEELLDKINS
jgi:hypothetical protein